MADAVALAWLAGTEALNWALGHAAVNGRFGEGDLASVVSHRASVSVEALHAGEDHPSSRPGEANDDGIPQVGPTSGQGGCRYGRRGPQGPGVPYEWSKELPGVIRRGSQGRVNKRGSPELFS